MFRLGERDQRQLPGALRSQVAALDPRNFRVRSQLARDHVNLAGSYRMLKRTTDAKHEIVKAREIIATLGANDSAASATALADAEMGKMQGRPTPR